MIDFKISKQREEDGKIVSQTVRFYEGSIVQKTRFDIETRSDVVVDEYQRTSLIEEIEYTYE